MTTWTDVINYVRARYEVLQETDGWLRFRLGTSVERTQQVVVHLVPDGNGGEWVEISSPVGRIDEIDPLRLLEFAGTSVVGGAAVVAGVALLKHTVPLADLSAQEEFERPLAVIVASADAFESELTPVDRF